VTESDRLSKGLSGRLLGYMRGDLRPDAVAGLTVAVMGIPQAMAYALIAGLPPIYGLYTAVITCSVAALLGSSSHLVTGPTNALCMVLLSLTAHLPQKYGVSPLAAVLLLTFMTGLIQLGFGLLRLGGLVRYVSRSVVIGFTAGAGVLIAINQLKNILGVDISEAHVERSYEVLIVTFRHLGELNPYALAIGVATALLVVGLPRINRRLPGALLALVITGAISYLLGWHVLEMGAHRVEIVKDIQEISGSFPAFSIPSLVANPNYELTRELGSGAVALAVLGLLEAASIARSVATQTNQRLDFTREFIAQGTSNIVGSFFSCFAGSGSFTRTAVCYQSGGRTRMAATFSALWSLIALLLLGPIANYIPKAGLAGLLIVIAYSMVDKHRLTTTWRSGVSPRTVLAGTLLATLLLPLEYAIFFGVFLSVVFLLRTTGRTDLTQLVELPGVGFEEVPFNQAAPSPVVIVNMEGDLYFAAAGDLDYELMRCIKPQTRVVVLRMKRLRAVGSTAMAMLEHFWEILRKRGIALVVCGIEDELQSVMTGSGLRKRIGEQNIFYADNLLLQSTELALARAWSIAEMVGRLESPAAVPSLPSEGGVTATAGSIMSARCVRFGNQHQLREATWLMSELYKHTRTISPETLFLQHRNGRLAGGLSPWRILRALSAGIEPAKVGRLDDRALGDLLRKHFPMPIGPIARVGYEHAGTETPVAHVLRAALKDDLQVLPICEADGRIKGLVSQDDILRWLSAILDQLSKEDGHE
jgi:SulP family sulfate permease